MCGCYDCLRAEGITFEQRDILGQVHDLSDGRLILKRKIDEKRQKTFDDPVADASAPTIRLRLIGVVNIGRRTGGSGKTHTRSTEKARRRRSGRDDSE